MRGIFFLLLVSFFSCGNKNTLTISYPFATYIPAVIVMSVSHDSGYAMICMGAGAAKSHMIIVLVSVWSVSMQGAKSARL